MITFDSATKLRDAGFTQPEKALYQTWYDRKGGIWQISTLAPHAEPVAICLTDTRWEFLHDTNGFIFAPTAVEILATMEGYLTDGTNIFKVNAGGYPELMAILPDIGVDNAAALCYLEDMPIGPKVVKYLTGRKECPDMGTVDGVELECGDMHLWVPSEQNGPNGTYNVSIDPAIDSLSQCITGIAGPNGMVTEMWVDRKRQEVFVQKVDEEETHGLDKVSRASVLDAVGKFKPAWVGDPDRSMVQRPVNSDGSRVFPSREENPSNPAGFAGTYTPLPEVEKICGNCKHYCEWFMEGHGVPDYTGLCFVQPCGGTSTNETDTCRHWAAK